MDISLLQDRKTIIYLIDDLEIGGAQVHLVRLVNEMSSLFQIEIISLGAISEKLTTQFPKNIIIRVFEMSSIRNIIFFHSFIKLIIWLRNRKPEIVHTYLNTANVFGLIAARLAGVKSVITSRRDMGHFRSGRLGFIEGLNSKLFAARVFCVCKAVAKLAQDKEHIPSEKLRVILNGVDINHFQPKKTYKQSGVINFGIVASMNRLMKGHFDFIRAVKAVSEKKDGQMAFYLVGDGPFRKELEEFTHISGISNIVHFIGEKRDVVPILSQIDVLVVPSHSEGISNAALEAMASGIPVIASAVDGNLEVVVHNETGLLFPVKDVKALKECFIKYSNNYSLIEIHGRNARERVKQIFNMDKMKENYFKLYCDEFHF